MNGISNVSQLTRQVMVDGKEVSQSGSESQGKVPELKTGSTIQGTVVSITDTDGGKIANVEVGDSVISAKLQDGMNLREGQTLNFNVKSSGPGGVSITPLYENTSADQSTLKALAAAGLEINNDNIQMVKDMMEAQLPINREALLEMSKNLQTYQNSSISTMVEMKSLNIPINENNIQQFQSYKNYEHQVTGAIESIIDELPEAFNELSAAGNDSGALKLYGQVLKLFSEGVQTETGTVTDPGKETESAGQTAALDTEADAAGKQAQVQEETGKAAMGQNAEETALLQGEIEGGEKGAESSKMQGTLNTLEESASGENGAAKGTQLDSRFVDNLRNLGISEDTIKNYNEALKLTQNGESSPKLELAQKELLKELSQAFEQSDLNTLGDKTVWKNIFSHDDYSKLLKDSISSQWTLKPGDVEKKENIDNLYQRLGNQIKGLTETISNTLGAESKLGQTANNLQNNLDFMNQLNQMFQYVQLPLQMTGQNVHGDLFVYRNKHRKMSEDGSVSAVLHLDMEHMGPVDVYVKLLDTKVTTNFYVADEDVIDLINDNIHILNERLEKRGYTMNVTLKLHDEMDGQDAAVDEMLDVMKTPVISTASFDARA
ncbi:MAG: flagellar hook-length control protein FliK [Butyrivibrio sp.]|nr:flagellar hook-length control protein FliK [Butyrivibrio sp.]